MIKRKNFLKTLGMGIAVLFMCAAMALPAAIGNAAFVHAEENASATEEGFKSEHSKSEMLKASKKLNLKIAEESAVLLKNNNALPLAKTERDVTVFHSKSNTMVGYFGGGKEERYMVSALAAFTGFDADDKKSSTIYESFDENNIRYNPKVKGMYDEASYYTDNDQVQFEINTRRGPNLDVIKEAEKSFINYDDAAIITISRIGREGYDGLRLQDPDEGLHVFDKKPNTDEHYLQLNEGEKKLLDYVGEHFNKVIVLLNTPMPIEIAELQDSDKVSAVMWIGYPGYNGFMALGELLTGSVNPSGRLVDTWAADITKDPVWMNYYNNSQNSADGKPHYSVLDKNGKDTGYVSVDYSEGIYVGYKFYETAAEIGYFDGAEDMPTGETDTYYNRTNGVVYPFGYGLSYTSFTQEIVEETKTTAGANIEFDVKVTNTGKTAGKEVVQVYYNPPYTEGGIEKSAANLIAFAKTKELAAGDSQTIHISFAKRDMASYDYDNANGDANGHKGYELEAGAYEISVKSDSHEEIESFVWNNEQRMDYDADSATGAPIEQLFSGDDMYNTDRSKYSEDGNGLILMSRAEKGGANGFKATFPESAGDVTFSDEAIAFLDTQGKRYTSNLDKETDPFYVSAEEIAALEWTQETDPEANRVNGWSVPILLADMMGIDYMGDALLTDNDTKVTEFVGKSGREAWSIFMDQLTWDEMITLVSDGNFRTVKLDPIGKPETEDHDGPAQIGANPGAIPCMNFASGVNFASTWNVDLAEAYGKLIGDHAINQGYTGWYGPGMNIHRSPFGGRNYEYYSEDPILTGRIASGAIKGAVSKGIITYMKHFALNNQEESRHGILTWADEQTLRELYLKPFEIAVKEGGATGVMDSFNAIGGVGACMNNVLNVKLLTEEWGFRGIIVSDFYGDSGWPAGLIVRSQVMPLGTYVNEPTGRVEGTWNATKGLPEVTVKQGDNAVTVESPTLYYSVRMTAQRILYGVVNSNGMGVLPTLDESLINDINVTLKQGEGGYRYLGFGNDDNRYGYVITKMVVSGDTVTDCSRGAEWFTLFNGFDWHKGGDSLYDTPEAGVYKFKLLAVNGYLRSAEKDMTITVTSAFKEKNFAGTQRLPFEGQIELVDGAAIRSINSCAVAAGSSLPEGLTVSANGKISGTPSQTGTFDVKFVINGKYIYNTTITLAEKTTITVTFDMNYDGGVNATAEAASGAVVTKPSDPEREGFMFEGWFADEACTTAVDVTKSVTEATTYYAKWTELLPGFRVHDGMLQYSEDGKTWRDIIAMSELKGEDGLDGKDGADGKDGQNGKDGANGGCGGSIAGTAALGGIMLAVGVAAAAIVAVRRKKNGK